jgi:hypothetical protein
MKRPKPKPPIGAREGTVWFGGPIDRIRVTLRVVGEDLDPEAISTLLGCTPTHAEKKGVPVVQSNGTRIPKRGRWSLELNSEECDEWDLEELVKALLDKLPGDLTLWRSLAAYYNISDAAH